MLRFERLPGRVRVTFVHTPVGMEPTVERAAQEHALLSFVERLHSLGIPAVTTSSSVDVDVTTLPRSFREQKWTLLAAMPTELTAAWLLLKTITKDDGDDGWHTSSPLRLSETQEYWRALFVGVVRRERPKILRRLNTIYMDTLLRRFSSVDLVQGWLGYYAHFEDYYIVVEGVDMSVSDMVCAAGLALAHGRAEGELFSRKAGPQVRSNGDGARTIIRAVVQTNDETVVDSLVETYMGLPTSLSHTTVPNKVFRLAAQLVTLNRPRTWFAEMFQNNDVITEPASQEVVDPLRQVSDLISHVFRV